MKIKELIKLDGMLDGKIKWHDNEEWIRVIGTLLRDHLVDHHNFVVVEEVPENVESCF